MAFAGCAAARPKTMPRAAPKLSREEAQEPWKCVDVPGVGRWCVVYLQGPRLSWLEQVNLGVVDMVYL